MEQLIEVLSNFGFPVACCGILMWYIYQLNRQHKDELQAIMSAHKEETDKLTESINSNTLVLTKLLERMGA